VRRTLTLGARVLAEQRRGALQGVELKKKKEVYDVLGSAGVKNKTLKYGVGIPLSFVADPLSYVALAAAPESGGSSLAALGPKAAKVAKLLDTASSSEKAAIESRQTYRG